MQSHERFDYLIQLQRCKYYKTTLVHQILDYCSTVWNPHLLKNIWKLKSVQRRATKFILSLCDLFYTDHEQLQSLNLPNLCYIVEVEWT